MDISTVHSKIIKSSFRILNINEGQVNYKVIKLKKKFKNHLNDLCFLKKFFFFLETKIDKILIFWNFCPFTIENRSENLTNKKETLKKFLLKNVKLLIYLVTKHHSTKFIMEDIFSFILMTMLN